MCPLKHENYLLCKKQGWSNKRIAEEYELQEDDLEFYIKNNSSILNRKRNERLIKITV